MVIEILPNWHPIFVHFTLALLCVGSVIYCVAAFTPENKELRVSASIAAHWLLWVGALFTLATLIAGFHAYATVAHDGASHIAMTDHRNWALATAAVTALFAGLTYFRFNQKTPFKPFTLLALLLLILLTITGYKGSELVYRYGLGVQALPKVGDDHHQSGGEKQEQHDHHHDHDHAH